MPRNVLTFTGCYVLFIALVGVFAAPSSRVTVRSRLEQLQAEVTAVKAEVDTLRLELESCHGGPVSRREDPPR